MQRIPVHLNYVGQAMTWEKHDQRWRGSVLRPVPEALPPPRPEDLPGYDALLPHGNIDDKVCLICSDKNRLRLESIANNQTHYFCPCCKSVHDVGVQTKRRIIIFSSSTLHNAISHLNVKIIYHQDVETIPGGKVWDMERVFKKIYDKDPTPVDAVIVCGLNQIKWQPVQGVMASYRSMAQVIKEHSIRNKHAVPNTTTISTLPYPPKFATFRNPDHPKYPTYLTPETNLVSKIDQINKEIITFNQENIENREGQFGADEMVGIHKFGIRYLGGGKNLPIGRREHRWSAWFEKEDARKLHLKHELRATILHRMQLFLAPSELYRCN